MRKLVFVIVAVIGLTASAAQANTIPEYRLMAGAFIPTGGMADVMKSSVLLGMQGGVELSQRVHLVATIGYATPRPKLFAATNDIHVYQYDAGAELFHVYSSDAREHWSVRPFVGAGVGGRTYDFQKSDLKSHSDFTGYGSLGTELQHTGIAARLEVRDYLSRFNGLTGGVSAKTRNNLVVGGGLSYHF